MEDDHVQSIQDALHDAEEYHSVTCTQTIFVQVATAPFSTIMRLDMRILFDDQDRGLYIQVDLVKTGVLNRTYLTKPCKTKYLRHLVSGRA